MLRSMMIMLTIAMAVSFVPAVAIAGGSAFQFSLTGGAGAAGDSFTSAALLDNAGGGDIQGWSFGVCSDPAALTVDGAASGADTETAKNGSAPDFNQISTFADGATQGVVLCFTGCAVIGDTSGFEMLTIDYTIAGSSDTTIDYCGSLGAPPVNTVVVVGGASLAPATTGGLIDVINPNQLSASSGTAVLGDAATTTVSFNNVNYPAIDAVQINLGYDNTVVSAASVDADFAFETFLVQDFTGNSGEIVVGGLADITPPLDGLIPAGASTDLFTVTWNTDAEGTSAMTFPATAGSPAQDLLFVAGQSSLETPTLIDGSLTVVNFNQFLRSDCNSDGTVNIADGVFGINYLFQGGPDPVCDDACDSNDDGAIDAADMIYIFNYRFLEGPAPLAPFPSADLDPTPGDGLGCDGDADDL